jgi:hypothetical protein
MGLGPSAEPSTESSTSERRRYSPDQLNKPGHLRVEKKRRGQVANVEAKIRHHDAEAAAGENCIVGSHVAGHVDDATGSS